MSQIDLRSDTVTRPTQAMREAMASAVVGDDVYREDPTVNALERLACELLDKEAALFVSSGTQGNLLGILSHCGRGDEYLVGQSAHTYKYEAGGAAVLGSIQPQPLDFSADGTLDLDKAASAVKPDDFHHARTRLLCLENTQGGKVLPLPYLDAARAFCDQHGLGLHLDGARVFNAAVKQGVPVATISRPFDSVSVCLSKGLGAPVGSLLCASAGLVAEARRYRKMLGGGMRQAGVLAAAGMIALEQHVERLAQDHQNARRLAAGLADIEELNTDPNLVQTNMVFVALPAADRGALSAFLRQNDIIIDSNNPLRLVTHLDITSEDIDTMVARSKDFYAGELRRARA